MKVSLKNDSQRELVLTKAILNLATFYGLSGEELSQI